MLLTYLKNTFDLNVYVLSWRSAKKSIFKGLVVQSQVKHSYPAMIVRSFSDHSATSFFTVLSNWVGRLWVDNHFADRHLVNGPKDSKRQMFVQQICGLDLKTIGQQTFEKPSFGQQALDQQKFGQQTLGQQTLCLQT
jgi:hypothetical protein